MNGRSEDGHSQDGHLQTGDQRLCRGTSANDGHVNSGMSRGGAAGLRFGIGLVLGLLVLVSSTSVVYSAPSQEDVFKSIQNNVGSSTDPTKFVAFLLGAAGLVVLLALLNARRNREAKPRVLNHQGRLLKEIARTCDLRSSEIRQL